MKSNEMRKTRLTLLFIQFGFILIAITLAVLFLVLCRIKNIEVVGNKITSTDNIIASTQLKLNSHIYSMNESKVEKLIKDSNPYIVSVNIKKELPSKIKIIVTESDYLFLTCRNDKYYILTSELKIVEKYDSIDDINEDRYINLVIPEFVQTDIGETLDFGNVKQTQQIKEIISQILSSKLIENIKEIDVKSRFDISLKYGSYYTIVYGDYADLPQKIANSIKVIEYLDNTSQKREGTIYVLKPDEASFDPN